MTRDEAISILAPAYERDGELEHRRAVDEGETTIALDLALFLYRRREEARMHLRAMEWKNPPPPRRPR